MHENEQESKKSKKQKKMTQISTGKEDTNRLTL